MRRWTRARAALPLTALVFLLAPATRAARQAGVDMSGPERMKEDFVAVPCRDAERLAAVKSLFGRAGASPSDVNVEAYKNVENLVVVLKGESDEKLVVGAHYDKVSDGCGALDNWTGVVALAHLYRALKDLPLRKTVVFVAFGKEERGLVGSRAMAGAISKEQAAQYCAMINLDSLGLSPPQAADNLSSGRLVDFTAALAKEMKIPFRHAAVAGADADSRPFLGKKIPAVTIHGLDNDWKRVLHSRQDQASKVNVENVYLGYRLALAMVARLDLSPCAAYR